MAIFFHHHGGRADGIIPYQNKRSPDNPPQYAFFFSQHATYDPDELSQASVYKFNGTIITEGDDTTWHYDFDHYDTPDDAIRWMRDHVSANDADW